MGKIIYEGLIIVLVGCLYKMDISYVCRDFGIYNVVLVFEEF